MNPITSIQDITRLLQHGADPARAKHAQRFFKTGVGEYGEGDHFLGLTVPQVRQVVKASWRPLPLEKAIRLLQSPWHEVRLAVVLILVAKYQHGLDRDQIYTQYLANTARINNWDLVDASAHKIVGDYLLERPRDPLYILARSELLWERRISIIATFAYIAQGDLTDALALSTLLLHDREDLIHKAVGWVLREIGKHDQVALRTFLDAHAMEMPRTMLRYALEKFSVPLRRHYLTLEARVLY